MLNNKLIADGSGKIYSNFKTVEKDGVEVLVTRKKSNNNIPTERKSRSSLVNQAFINAFRNSVKETHKSTTKIMTCESPDSDTNKEFVKIKVTEYAWGTAVSIIDDIFVREVGHIFYTSNGAEKVLFKNMCNETITYVENHDSHGKVVSSHIIMSLNEECVTLNKKDAKRLIKTYRKGCQKIKLVTTKPNFSYKKVGLSANDESFIKGCFL